MTECTLINHQMLIDNAGDGPEVSTDEPLLMLSWGKGDARELEHVPDSSVDVIVTSPPYWKRRDYGHKKQLGQEQTPAAYVRALIRTLNSWTRVLRPHGSVFLNLGDTYQDGFLVGIPALFEVAVRKASWNVVNHIVWTKVIGMPEARRYRLASRHEPVYHLTRANKPNQFYFDLFSLAQDLNQSANPGDVWDAAAEPHDVWALFPARSRSDHLAPFPPDLARRAILLACPERVCIRCSQPHIRLLEPSAELDQTRPQARRAMELFQQANLTEHHFAAIRAVGIADAGKGKLLQGSSGGNSPQVLALAKEAKEALGGYFREFTFGPKQHVGWQECGCGGAPTRPGTVLDPFMGSGTTLRVAHELDRNAIGVDLMPPENI